MSSKIGQKQWEYENKIKKISQDELIIHDQKKQTEILQAKPWKKDVHYFKKIKISAIALLKMVMHTQRAAVSPLALTEVMGLLQGKVIGDTFIILDSFALPVEGTETRVSAGDEAAEYINNYTTLQLNVGKKENVVGWYHSHPGFGCWMSGVDCNTQKNYQEYSDPFCALVIDPLKTVSAGKVEIGGFRTYPDGYKGKKGSNFQMGIPPEKIKDFGKHFNEYYQLPIEFFKSSTDTHLLSLLWKKYWVKTLSTSPLLKNKFYSDKQIQDLAKKIQDAEVEIKNSRSYNYGEFIDRNGNLIEKKETQLSKINKDSVKLTSEILRGMISQITKNLVFNQK